MPRNEINLFHWTFCKRPINFCAKFSSESDHNSRAFAPECCWTLLMKSTSF